MATNVNEQLELLGDKENLQELNAFVQSLSDQEKQLHKTDITETYLRIYSNWYYDLILEKIKLTDPEEFVQELFGILSEAEKIDPTRIHYTERAECYQYLADKKAKPTYLQLAIDEYTKEGSKESKASIASALLDKMMMTKEFTDESFSEILSLFQDAFSSYSENVSHIFFYASFNILRFPTWHNKFIGELNTSLNAFAEKDPIIRLSWSDLLYRTYEYSSYDITLEYAEKLRKQSAELLEQLTDYPTDKPDLLNKLGNAFEKAARHLPKETAITYYKTALRYFEKGQSLQPAAWTFPVYATNVLKAMALLYDDKTAIIELFEKGRSLFEKVYEHEKDFTLNLYWAEYLVRYAKQVYDFKQEVLLDEAALRASIAKELGRNFYDQPFLLLAKVALKKGDREECIAILKQCKANFTTEYAEYEMNRVLEDEDFREIWVEFK